MTEPDDQILRELKNHYKFAENIISELLKDNKDLREALEYWSKGEASKILFGVANAARRYVASPTVSEQNAFIKSVDQYTSWCEKHHSDMLED